ncbi:MAG: NAD/NADP octopine/nopaline dehydrogenase family protein [Oscillospiraceae bacterium]
MKISVISSGNGGQAIAGYLSMKGCDVRLFTRVNDIVDAIERNGGIELFGSFTGKYPIDMVTTDIEKAIEGCEIIMVTTPAHYQRIIAEIMAPHLVDGQIIVLNPGRTFGTYDFVNTLNRAKCTADVTVAEAETFVFTCRCEEVGKATIFTVKDKVDLAAHIPERTDSVLAALKPYFDSFVHAQSVLYTGLQNVGMILHPTPILMNITRVERAENFLFYKEAITPIVSVMLERLDCERVSVAKKLGINVITALEWLKKSYNVSGSTLYDAIQANDAYSGVYTPKRLDTRYIFEDISAGLVPISSIARIIGEKTKNIDSIISYASNIYDYDFFANGRNSSRINIIGIIDDAMSNH